jgi:predicted DNA-binding transcriptional regulator AlpA
MRHDDTPVSARVTPFGTENFPRMAEVCSLGNRCTEYDHSGNFITTAGGPMPPLPTEEVNMPHYLTVAQVAAVSTVKETTLYSWSRTWATRSTGPRPMRLGDRVIRYATADVAAWLGLTEEALHAQLAR